ncbi:MAG: geranylgeranyl reductase family protein [Candidatus Lokiarchaeota archaeon]|nr:geranylgeranyl reductase family protein [Candidatus Lokiarchaeota archaeon]MBD3200557.1 geranylgeranyl reductase family protein [Candidatus Lokiarchaeota archaeon]
MYDVIISGAGPSGSKCAEILAKNGFSVALLEKDSNWRKPCGGGVSSRIFKYFPQLKKLNPHTINKISMYSGDYHKLEHEWEGLREKSIVMDRLELDNTLRNVAVDAGATLLEGYLSCDFLTKMNKKIGIKAKTSSGKQEVKSKIIILADGMSSKLARKSGLRGKWNVEDLGLAKCAILEGETTLDKEGIHVFFRPYKGYGWIFPLGEKRFNIGCGTFEEDNLNYDLNEIYTGFIEDPHIKKILSGQNYKTIWSGSFPLPAKGVLKESLYGDNIMLIGDNAGFVSPISGEGIHPGIVSGEAAAEAAINALEQDNISKKTLKHYGKNRKIRKIIQNFKLKRSMVEFFYENKGRNLSNMFRLAERNDDFRENVVDMFLFNAVPSKEFFAKIRELE